MMRSFKGTVLGGGMTLMALSVAWAQIERQAEQPARQQDRSVQRQFDETHQEQENLCMATKLIGMTVKAQDDEYGTIANLMINEEGEVQYLALKTKSEHQSQANSATQPRRSEKAADAFDRNPRRGVTGTTVQYTLVPWDLAEFPEERHGQANQTEVMTLKIEKDRLVLAPKFTEQHLIEQQGQVQWRSQVDQFFERQSRGAARPDLEDDAFDAPQRNREDAYQPDRQQDNQPRNRIQ